MSRNTTTWKDKLRASIDKVSETKVWSDEKKESLRKTTEPTSPALVQRLERALEEKQLQCEALFQAKQSMELSIRQVVIAFLWVIMDI